jgi:hypothetical protein
MGELRPSSEQIWRKRAWQIARWGVSVGLFGYVLARVDLRIAWSLVARLGGVAAIGAVLALAGKLAAGAARWLYILAALGQRAPWRRGVAVYLLGNALGQALPASVGGDAARIWLARDEGVDVRGAARSVVIDLLAGFASLCLMMLAATPSLYHGLAPAEAAGTVLAAALLGLAIIAGVLVAGRLTRGSTARLARALATIASDVRLLLLEPRHAAPLLGLSFLFQSTQVTAVYALARGLHVPLGLHHAFVLVPVVLTAMTLPLSMGGWGVRELGMVSLLGLAGVSDESAAVIAVLFGLFNLGIALVGGLVGWALRRRAAPARRWSEAP